jgi:hypothetical protein
MADCSHAVEAGPGAGAARAVLDDGIGRYRAELRDVSFSGEAGEGVEASCGSEVRRDRVLENLDPGTRSRPVAGAYAASYANARARTNGMIWNRF